MPIIGGGGGAGGAGVDATQEFFVPAPNPDSYKYDHHVEQMPDGVDTVVGIEFYIPHDFSSITSAVLVFIADATGNMQRSATSSFAASGEVSNTHTDTLAAGVFAMTIHEIEELDISGALTGIVAGDYVGIQFLRDGDNGSDTIGDLVYFVGLRFRYS